MTVSTSCCFCTELRTGTSQELRERFGDRLRSRTIWTTNDLVVIPSLGQLRFGHMLVVPREHANSFAALDASRRRRVTAEVEAAVNALERRFGEVVLFEHGTAVGSPDGGCGIVHAHLHVVPVGEHSLVLPQIDGGTWEPVSGKDWAAAVADLAGTGEYLFVRLPHAEGTYAVAVDGAPSQFLRQWVARGLGSDQWDWRSGGDYEAAIPLLVEGVRNTRTPALLTSVN